jgi:hypothetical protein
MAVCESRPSSTFAAYAVSNVGIDGVEKREKAVAKPLDMTLGAGWRRLFLPGS